MIYNINVKHYSGDWDHFTVEHHQPPSLMEAKRALENHLGEMVAYYNLREISVSKVKTMLLNDML